MIKNLRLKCLLIATALTVTTGIHAQNVKLVKDVNPNTDANPSGYTLVNGTSYFTADDGIHGTELWRTNGTAAGTTLVKDISLGTPSSNISCLTAFKGKLLFVVANPTGQQQLWSSDGTDAGTQLVKNVATPVTDFTIDNMVVVDSLVYFIAGNDYLSEKLWRTNGTSAGTFAVVDFYNSTFGYGTDAYHLVALNRELYFTLSTNSGNEVWRSDGTTAGTVMVKDINPGAKSSNASLLTPLNGRLYFTATDGSARRLWVTNGKADSTIALAGDATIRIALGSGGQFKVIKHSLFLFANISNTALAIYKYNTDSANSFALVHYIYDTAGGYNAIKMTTIKDSLLFFIAYDHKLNQQLWVSAGSSSNCTLLKSNPLVGYYSFYDNITGTQQKMFFIGYNSSTGFEPWVSDGTVAGTHIVSDVFSGIYSSQPSSFSSLSAGVVLFTAADGKNGFELWRTDGNNTTASLVKDINKTTTANSYGSTSSIPYTNSNNNGLLFDGTDFTHGNELWKTDGTAAGTFMLKDVVPGIFNGFSGNVVKFKSDYIFSSDHALTDTMVLWKTDGTTNGTILIDTLLHSNQDYYHACAGRNLFYFQCWNSDTHPELWVTNGLVNGSTRLLSDGYQYGDAMVTKGDTLFFVKQTAAGTTLWVSTGTAASTKLLKMINPGGYSFYSFSMIIFNNKLYFTGTDVSGSNYLWVSDGTADGTQIVKKVVVSYFDLSSPRFIVLNNKFYFTGNDNTTGDELWVSDGTTAGTTQVKDINTGTASANVWNKVDVNGSLFFSADDGVHGTELWKTNGTDTGTIMVKDITPGAAGSAPQYMVNGNGLLYFVLNDTLWQSNGTGNGTHAINDAGLKGLSNIGFLVPSGNKLYFSAYSDQYGYELYVMGANSTLPVTMLSFTGQWAKNDAQLNWVTTNELNSSHFNIQRSLNGTTFTTIGQVKAQGTTSRTYRYNYTDANAASLPASSLYYRLQQVDLDGNATYSNLVRLPLANNSTITIAPNPAHKAAYIISSTTITGAAVTIADMAGHTVYSSILNLQAGAQVPLNIAGIPAGVYNVTIQNGLAVKQQSKLVVQ